MLACWVRSCEHKTDCARAREARAPGRRVQFGDLAAPGIGDISGRCCNYIVDLKFQPPTPKGTP